MKSLNLHILVKILLFWYIFIFFSTEILSYFRLIARFYIFSAELLFWLIILFFHRNEIQQAVRSIRFPSIYKIIVLILFALTFIQGFFSAPNSTDSMVYHLPRIMYWIQEKTLFQDTIRNVHDYMPPFGQYIMLHIYLIFDSDRFLFFSQWFAYVVITIVSAMIANLLGANKQIRETIALLVASIPVVVMQATSTKIELVVAVLVVVSIYIALRFRENKFWDYFAIGFSLGLGVLTKQTFLLYSVIPAGILFIKLIKSKRRYLLYSLLIAVIILVIQFRFLTQNQLIYGSISGAKSDYSGQAIQNISFQGISSNVIKNTMLHVPIPIYTKQAESVIVSLHRILGIDVNDCATTFCDPDFRFRILSAIYPQEDIASNTPQLILIIIGGIALINKLIKKRTVSFESIIYILSFGSFLAFATLVKWQPFHSRLHIPFFVIGTVSSVVILSKVKKGEYFLRRFSILSVFIAIVLILLNTTRPFISYGLFYNNLKTLASPLNGIPESLLSKPYEKQYYNSRFYWYKPYEGIMEMLSKKQLAKNDKVTYKLMDYFEYPLWVLARKKALNYSVVSDYSEISSSIIISTSIEPYYRKGYDSVCLETEIEYGYACLLTKNSVY